MERPAVPNLELTPADLESARNASLLFARIRNGELVECSYCSHPVEPGQSYAAAGPNAFHLPCLWNAENGEQKTLDMFASHPDMFDGRCPECPHFL